MHREGRLRHGAAKVEFFACLETIKGLREAGYSIKAIYDRLSEDGLITMSYKALHDNLSKLDSGSKPLRKKQIMATQSRPVDSMNINPTKAQTSQKIIPPSISDDQAERRRHFNQLSKTIQKKADNFINHNPEANPSEMDSLTRELIHDSTDESSQ